MEKKVYVGPIEKVRGFELKEIGSMMNQKLTSILFGLLYQLEEDDVKLLGREEVHCQAPVLGLLNGMYCDLDTMFQLIFDPT